MTHGFTRKFIRTFLAAAMVMTMSAGLLRASEGGGGGERDIVNTGKVKVKAKAKAKAGKRRGGRKVKKAPRKAGSKKWEMRDRNGKRLYKIERSRITRKYYVGRYGKDPRSGKTTVRVKLDGKVRTITVQGEVAGA